MTNPDKRSVQKMARFTKKQWAELRKKKLKKESDSNFLVRGVVRL